MEHRDPMPSIWYMLFPLLFSVDILLNRSQQLFASCTAKFADGQQCSIPVFDITHQTPLCEEHAKKMVSSMLSIEGKFSFLENARSGSQYKCAFKHIQTVLGLLQWCFVLF